VPRRFFAPGGLVPPVNQLPGVERKRQGPPHSQTLPRRICSVFHE
jgi:hypothetical protein